ncbi:hypothetical protein [Bifidobacterium tsurumiense]|uniref:Uncharacterized protein n=1 Tax=Bifidobacterium tsurumiense TaxID=356829 RepID=A0A087ECT2_9BIFI|nr:hypothetical protein [Bifidobacterium tsurumiense]KFJ05583.1 hypothetical protein BITS_0269 [Bifidobacterium tsurumiense]MDY4678532.1 hypothetical protein [Bifidobacterium tsurumiense]
MNGNPNSQGGEARYIAIVSGVFALLAACGLWLFLAVPGIVAESAGIVLMILPVVVAGTMYATTTLQSMRASAELAQESEAESAVVRSCPATSAAVRPAGQAIVH